MHSSQTMTAEDVRGAEGRLAAWCGWVMTGLALLTPLFAWLGPLGLAAMVSLAGLLCLPAVRIGPRETPVAIILLFALAWAGLSSLWSTYRPAEVEDSVALKLAGQVVFYWAAWQGARAADPAGRRRALAILAWGLTAHGVILLIEAFTDGAIYQAIRNAIGDPIRPDLGRKNIAHGSFVLALLWPVAAAAAGQARAAPLWLAIPMAAGVAVLAQIFLSDAPVLSVGLAIAAGAAIWAWPKTAPKVAGIGAALLYLLMPLAILVVRAFGLGEHLPDSWSQRLGYWTYAMERISEHPWRGWGLDSSRAFSPYIQLHPHNGPLQIWLELGAIGAAFAALIWAFSMRRLGRDERSLVAAGAAGSAAVYLLFATVSFGVWQEWWIAAGALIPIIAALADPKLDED